MMDDDRRRRLLRKNLERFREIHAERFPRWEELEDGSVIVEISTRAVAPRVPLPARHSHLLLDAPMRPLRHRLGCFHRQAVRVERFGVLVLRLQLLESLRRFLAHGYDCLLYTSDAADDLLCVDLGGRRIIKKKNNKQNKTRPTR